jgi:hypothetical protein
MGLGRIRGDQARALSDGRHFGQRFFGFDNGKEGESAAADLRVFGAAEWGPVRLEGGYRFNAFDLNEKDEELRYTLYGPYVLASAIFRF